MEYLTFHNHDYGHFNYAELWNAIFHKVVSSVAVQLLLDKEWREPVQCPMIPYSIDCFIMLHKFCICYFLCSGWAFFGWTPAVLWCCWLGGRKGIWPVKNMGSWGCGGVVSPDGVAPTRTAGASIITPASTKKSRRMMAYNNIDFGFNPVGAPTCLRKQEVGKPSLNAAQPYAKAWWPSQGW